MSAAEPATPEPPMNTTAGAAVIDLDRQRPKRRALDEARGRWGGTMNTASGDQSDHDADASEALRRWASSIETSFIEIGQSLTRDDTAATFLRSLDVFERTLEGLHAQGVIDRGQLGELSATIGDLRKVPGLV